MNGCCKEVIEPSVKLSKIVSLLKIIAFAHFFIIVGDLFIFGTGFFFFLLFQFIVLLISISSKHFGHYLFFILVSSFNTYMIIELIGIWLQVGFYANQNMVSFCFLVFILIFEIFSICVIYTTYKQSKHEYRISFGFAPGEAVHQNDNIEQLNNIDNNENNNDGVISPFQGHNIAVGRN